MARAGETAWPWTSLTVLSKDLGLFSITHVVAYKLLYVIPVQEGLMPSCDLHTHQVHMWNTHIHAVKHSYT